MAENVLIALKRKREAGTFNNDTVWDSRARKELASNWSDYVEPGNDFDDSVAELRSHSAADLAVLGGDDGGKLSHTDLSSPAQPWAGTLPVALAEVTPGAFS
jgi:hypothetical protein